MSEILDIELQGELLQLHPLKALYWPGQSILFLADLHLGKAAHFRKSGIPVPERVKNTNRQNLEALLHSFSPGRVIFLGDLFHSRYNLVWDELGQFMAQFPKISFELVPGNHDILSPEHYESLALEVHNTTLVLPPFICSHHPLTESALPLYNLAGHIHPSVLLAGGARQKLRLPCFYFGKTGGILPAFGAFTGTANIQPMQGDRIFVITEDAVVAVE